MRKVIIACIFLILILPIFSAVEFDMKEEFLQGETLMARISGNFIEPILKENVFFYRGHVKIPINFDISKINNEYYLYAQLVGKSPGNYSIEIVDTKYMRGDEVITQEIVKNFSIRETQSDFLITPGFIITEDLFEISVQNLQDFKITISIKTSEEETSSGNFWDFLFGTSSEKSQDSISVLSGEIKKLKFNVNQTNESKFEFLEFSTENITYQIPIYVLATDEAQEQKLFRFNPSELKDIYLVINSNDSRIIYLENIGKETVENITLSISDVLKPYVILSTEQIKELKINESTRIILYFSAGDELKFIEGQITAKTSEKDYAYSSIFLSFVKEFIPNDSETTPEISTTTQTCEELNGTVCDSNYKCSGEEVYAQDARCCLEKCEEIKKSSSGKVIGWMLLVIVIIFLVWFFLQKYRGASRTIDLLKFGKRN